ncbi:AN1-type zinc finger protein 6-like protein, partial [Leptotrombidium deliense]
APQPSPVSDSGTSTEAGSSSRKEYSPSAPVEAKKCRITDNANVPQSPTSVNQTNDAISPSSVQSVDVSSTSETPKTDEKQKKKTRCTHCKVKVGVIGFPCRCGGVFCANHRYANEHKCNFDYKELGAEEIRKSNPKVVGEKIKKL